MCAVAVQFILLSASDTHSARSLLNQECKAPAPMSMRDMRRISTKSYKQGASLFVSIAGSRDNYRPVTTRFSTVPDSRPSSPMFPFSSHIGSAFHSKNVSQSCLNLLAGYLVLQAEFIRTNGWCHWVLFIRSKRSFGLVSGTHVADLSQQGSQLKTWQKSNLLIALFRYLVPFRLC